MTSFATEPSPPAPGAGVGAFASVGDAGVLGARRATAAVLPPAGPDLGVAAYPFELGQGRLTGLVVGVQDMATGDGGLAVARGDTGTTDQRWDRVTAGTAVKFRNADSGKLLAILNGSSTWCTQAVQDADNGSADDVDGASASL